MIHGITLYAVYRRCPMSQSRLEAFLTIVSRIGQTAYRDDIFRNVIPYCFEHLAVVDIRFREFVIQNQKGIDFNGRMNLHPVLIGSMIIWRFFPATLSATETTGICGYDGLPSMKAIQNEAVEPLPDVVPTPGSVLSAQNRVSGNCLESKKIPETFQQSLSLSECQVEELPHKIANHQFPFANWRAASSFSVLPEGKRIHDFPDSLHRKMKVLDQPSAVSGYRRYSRFFLQFPCIHFCLTRKLEYCFCYTCFDGDHFITFLDNWMIEYSVL